MRALLMCVLVVMACGGGGEPARPPAATVDHVLTLARDGKGAAAARMLGREVRGGVSDDENMERLAYWLWLRGGGDLRVLGETFASWSPPQAESTSGGTATVTTVLTFRSLGGSAERPVPLVIDLQQEGGAWRITNARMSPLPPWFTALQAEAATLGGPVEPPRDLAAIAATFRPRRSR